MASSFEFHKYFKDNKRAQPQKFNAARRANRPGNEGWLDLDFTGLDTKPVIVFVREKRGDFPQGIRPDVNLEVKGEELDASARGGI